jgi:hypothetical protein
MVQDSLPDSTRRAVLKSMGAALGVGAAGSAAGHPGEYGKEGKSADEVDGQRFALDDGEQFRNADNYGYHSMASTGGAALNGQPGQRHPGDTNAEMRCRGDLAVVTYRQSGEEDAGRRMATLDISEFNDASTEAELAEAELTVLGILRNFSAEANLATDVKLSRDGNYAFIGTQDLTPYRGGGDGAYNDSDPRGNAETSGGVVAVDITDPARPRTVDRIDEAFSTGIHNVFHHRIDGTDYVFACKDAGLVSPDSGLVVLRFDRDPAKLTIVNRWTADGNTVRGGVGPEHGLSYVHDVEIQDDPRTGRPTAYLADWDRGMRVLDVSDPTNIQHVGQFDMNQSHFAAPFPDLVEDADGNMRRVAVASHEEPDARFDQRFDANSAIYKTPHPEKTNPNSTGTVFLVDCEEIYPEDSPCGCGHEDGPTQLGELDNWTWKNVDTGTGFDDDTGRWERWERIIQPTFSFQLSPHNSQPAVHEIDGETRYIIHQGHYHGGIRYLEVEPGSADGLTGDARRDYQPQPFDPEKVDNYEASGGLVTEGDPTREQYPDADGFGWINNSTDWNVRDVGHARPTNDEDGSLSPDFWSSVEHNGLSYHADRGAGVYVTKHDDVPMTAPLPPLEAERADDGSAFLAGQTNRVEISVETFERPNGDAAAVRVRDRMPSGYEVIAGDDVETYPQGNRTAVEFTATVAPGDSATLTYFVTVPADPGSGTFGPVEVSADGDEWDTVGGTTDSNVEAGFNV